MISVVFATFNGECSLPATLTALGALESPDGGWRLVVVDNGSTDATALLLASSRATLPLVCLTEPRRGKNAALNRALPHATGDLIVFTDDDVLPRPDWLRQLRASVERAPAASVFGGPILPRWESVPPEAVLAGVPLGPAFALLPPGVEGPIRPRHIFGPNMAIRRSVLEGGYRFADGIGPDGSRSYAMGSESELLRRLERDGFTGWHVRAAVVEHCIRADQLRRAWLFQRAFRYGRGQQRLALIGDVGRPAGRRSLGVPRHVAGLLLRQTVRLARTSWWSADARTLRSWWDLGESLGTAYESRRAPREGRGPPPPPA